MRAGPLYRSRWAAPVVALALVALAANISGCASAPQPVEQVEPQHGFEDPEAAVDAFAKAWNAREDAALVGTFAPDRRGSVRTHLEIHPHRVQGFEVVSAAVSKQCHPRGAYWKTATLKLRARGRPLAGEVFDEEIVWLRLQDGHWFMYSL